MKSSAKKVELASVDDLFSTEESRADAQREKVLEIPLSELHPFKDHPFKVKDDEATTGLDTKARRGVWKSLQELKKHGLTIFLSSHFMDEVEILCDRIGILKDGGFAFEGTVEEAVALSPYEKLEDAYLWFTGEEEEDNE